MFNFVSPESCQSNVNYCISSCNTSSAHWFSLDSTQPNTANEKDLFPLFQYLGSVLDDTLPVECITGWWLGDIHFREEDERKVSFLDFSRPSDGAFG